MSHAWWVNFSWDDIFFLPNTPMKPNSSVLLLRKKYFLVPFLLARSLLRVPPVQMGLNVYSPSCTGHRSLYKWNLKYFNLCPFGPISSSSTPNPTPNSHHIICPRGLVLLPFVFLASGVSFFFPKLSCVLKYFCYILYVLSSIYNWRNSGLYSLPERERAFVASI